MAGVNKVILVGRLGADPEVRYTDKGTAVAKFNIATDETWKDKDGQKQSKTEWHRCVAFGKLGEICGEYLSKGKQVYVEGKLQTRSWEDDSGEKRYATEVNISSMVMLDGKAKAEGGQDSGYAPSGSEDDIPF